MFQGRLIQETDHPENITVDLNPETIGFRVQSLIPQIYAEAPNLIEAKLLDLDLEADYSNIFGTVIYTMERFAAEQEKGKGKAIPDYLISLK